MIKPTLLSLLSSVALTALASGGQTVDVTARGVVEFNQINSGALGQIGVGADVTISFQVDANLFVNHATLPTRGYVIDESSFSFQSGLTSVGLQDPFPGGMTPYFVLRDNDPAVDGFFLGTSLSVDNGVPLEQTGGLGQFISQFKVTYGGSTLPSLDIIDALGTYDFTGLTVFNFTVDDGPFQAMGLIFTDLVLSSEPGTAFCAGDGSGTACPCANDSPFAGEGCRHSGGFGMLVTGSGSSSIAADDLVLTATQVPVNNTGIFYTGTNSLAPGNHLFDGLQCAGGSVRRFQGILQNSGTAQDTGFVAQAGAGYFVAGVPYHFQFWSRDVALPSPCGNGANFSPGYAVTMTL